EAVTDPMNRLRLRIGNLSTEVIEPLALQEARISELLSVEMPKRWHSQAHRNRRWDGVVRAYSTVTKKFPTGHLEAVLKLAVDEHWGSYNEDLRAEPATFLIPTALVRPLRDVKLRDYQEDAVNAVFGKTAAVGSRYM